MEFDLEKSIEILEKTPGTVKNLLENLSHEWIYTNEGPETWSPFDIVGHLISGEEDDWMQRCMVILEHGTSRPFVPFDRLAMFEKSKGKTMQDLLGEFEKLRRDNIDKLRSLDLKPEQIELKGIHPEFGEATIGQLTATWVVHDLSHIRQITRVMAKQYTTAIGPWAKYLPVLEE